MGVCLDHGEEMGTSLVLALIEQANARLGQDWPAI